MQRFVVCFTVEQTCKIIIILCCDGEQEFSFSTFAARIKFPNLFLLFLLILKRFQKVFKSFLPALLSVIKCLLHHYNNFSLPIKA